MHWLFFWRPPCLLRTVIVNMKADDSTALRGILWSARGPWLVLREVSVLRANAATPIDGEVVVHRDNVAFLQVP